MPEAAMDDGPDSDANIEIRLGRPQQLFNSFDPSPFHERDLDEDAEAYIVDSVDEFPLQKRLRLIIHLPAEQLPAGNTPDLRQATQLFRLPAEREPAPPSALLPRWSNCAVHRACLSLRLHRPARVRPCVWAEHPLGDRQ
jgi:hypothetical protein